jgi:hypothetical protein
MNEFKVGDRIMVQLTGGRLVDAEIKAIIETIQGKRLQVAFGKRPHGFIRGRLSRNYRRCIAAEKK